MGAHAQTEPIVVVADVSQDAINTGDPLVQRTVTLLCKRADIRWAAGGCLSLANVYFIAVPTASLFGTDSGPYGFNARAGTLVTRQSLSCTPEAFTVTLQFDPFYRTPPGGETVTVRLRAPVFAGGLTPPGVDATNLTFRIAPAAPGLASEVPNGLRTAAFVAAAVGSLGGALLGHPALAVVLPRGAFLQSLAVCDFHRTFTIDGVQFWLQAPLTDSPYRYFIGSALLTPLLLVGLAGAQAFLIVAWAVHHRPPQSATTANAAATAARNAESVAAATGERARRSTRGDRRARRDAAAAAAVAADDAAPQGWSLARASLALRRSAFPSLWIGPWCFLLQVSVRSAALVLWRAEGHGVARSLCAVAVALQAAVFAAAAWVLLARFRGVWSDADPAVARGAVDAFLFGRGAWVLPVPLPRAVAPPAPATPEVPPTPPPPLAATAVAIVVVADGAASPAAAPADNVVAPAEAPLAAHPPEALASLQRAAALAPGSGSGAVPCPPAEWPSPRWLGTSAAYSRRLGPLFQHQSPGRHWFVVVELAVSAAFGMLEAVRTPPDNGCVAVSGAAVGIGAFYFATLFFARPYAAPADTALTFGGAAVAVVAPALLAVFHTSTGERRWAERLATGVVCAWMALALPRVAALAWGVARTAGVAAAALAPALPVLQPLRRLWLRGRAKATTRRERGGDDASDDASDDGSDDARSSRPLRDVTRRRLEVPALEEPLLLGARTPAAPATKPPLSSAGDATATRQRRRRGGSVDSDASGSSFSSDACPHCAGGGRHSQASSSPSSSDGDTHVSLLTRRGPRR